MFSFAQSNTTTSNDGFTVTDNTTTFNPNAARDSLKATHKKIPKGMYVWTIDERFGDITPVPRDTDVHLFMKQQFTTGTYGEYNTTGNVGDPRISRIATDRDFDVRDPFLEPYGYFITKPSELRYTNTLSPCTNLFYASCGGSKNGEDHVKVMFAVNANKRLGFGFKFNYIYGRGFFPEQNTALFNYTFWTSYRGSRYQAHFSMSFDHMKVKENGGLTNDDFLLHPESITDSYDEDEMPTVLSNNFNNQDAFHLNFAHRYSLGFYRKVPMTQQEIEAKKFAMKSKEENDAKKEQQKKDNGTKRQEEHSSTLEPKKKFTGRPDNAVIVGNLPKDAKEKRIAADDSIARHMRDSIIAIQKEPVDTSWMKKEYVPVTSFIHTLAFNTNNRRYVSNSPDSELYSNKYTVPLEAPGDSVNDITKYYQLRNTFAIGLLEGFNKWVPMGLKAYFTYDITHYTQPNQEYSYTSYNEHNIFVGGEILKTLGKHIHYKAIAEFGLAGESLGDIRVDATGDLNMRIFRDTSQVKLKAFYHLTTPNFVQRHFCGKNFFWDNESFSKQMQLHLEAEFYLRKTKTRLRACYDNINKYVYLGIGYNRTTVGQNTTVSKYWAQMMQASTNISLITVQLEQDVRWKIINWENRLTYQKSSVQEILAVPDFNAWTNLYLNFKIAHVLRVHFGADMVFFTKYNAPEYCPMVGQFGVYQGEQTKVGGAPIVSVYVNMQLKKCRFFLMMSNITGTGQRFFTPHQPLDGRAFRFGLSWDINN